MLLNNSTQLLATTSVTTYGPSIYTGDAYTFSAQCGVIVNTPTNPTFLSTGVNTTTGVITSTAHGLNQGQVVTLTTTDTLPAGLSLATTYYIIYLTANTFQIASSAANALAGTPIVPTDQGVGTHTVNVTALAGASVQLQKSNNNLNWNNDGSSVSVTTSGAFFIEKVGCTSPWMRVAYVLTSGSFQSSTVISVISF